MTIDNLACAIGSPVPAQAPAAQPVAPITVVNSPLVEKWLTQDGIPFIRRTGPGLGAAPIARTQLLVLPLEAIGGPAAAKHVQSYVSKGGRVLAIYWGSLASTESLTAPVYHLVPVLGVKPLAFTPEPGLPLIITSTGPGALPFGGREVNLARTSAIRMEAQPGTSVIARWTGENGVRPGAAFLRGSVLTVAANMLRPQNDRGEARDIFFWAVQRVAKDVGPGMQARDRIQQAVAAYASLSTAMNANPTVNVKSEASAAQDALAEARTQLGAGRAGRAIAAADRARTVAIQALGRIKAVAP